MSLLGRLAGKLPHVGKSADEHLDKGVLPTVPFGLGALRVLHSPAKPAVEIIFIHGLLGDPIDTWTKDTDQTERCLWPQDLLPTDIPNARISTLVPDPEARWSGYSLDRTANWIFDVISLPGSLFFRDFEPVFAPDCFEQRPIIFVAHDFGALIAQKVIVQRQRFNEGKEHNAILCMGFTQEERTFRERFEALTKSPRDQQMRPDTMLEVASDTVRRFRNVQEENRNSVKVAYCHPIKPLPNHHKYLEYEHEAWYRQKDTVIIDANQMDMTKFNCRDAGYQAVIGQLKAWVDKFTM